MKKNKKLLNANSLGTIGNASAGKGSVVDIKQHIILVESNIIEINGVKV